MNMTAPVAPAEGATPEKKPITLPENITAGQLIALYLKLRNRIKKREDEHKAELTPSKELLTLMNNKLLDLLNQAGGESIAAEAGTAYRTERVSASIFEAAEFRDYVIANELFDMIDWKANPTAVKDHIQEFGTPPPGVKITTALTVGVRTASGK